MTTIEYSQDRGILFSVLSSYGTFRRKVTADTPGATLRKYKTSDDKEGEKYELIAQKISGIIDSISIFDGEYGKNVIIGFKLEEGQPESEHVFVSLSSSSSFGEQFMAKLPNIDVEKEVTLSPYSFIGDDDKQKRGISITQNGEKIQDAYQTYNEKTKKWTAKKDFPTTEGDIKKFDSDDWKAYFIKVRKYAFQS